MVSPQKAWDMINRYLVPGGYDLILDIKKSKGLKLHDLKKDRMFLDFFGFFASSPLGMNHPKLFDKEFLEKLKYASLNKVTNSDIYTIEMAEFIDETLKIAPKWTDHLFFIDGGALAVENALKVAFDYKVRKNFAKGHKDEVGSKIIHLKESFHGRSGYTLSLTNTFDPRKTEYYPKFDWPRVTNPKIIFPLEENIKAVEESEKQSLSEIRGAINRHGDDIAAFIMEPIQAEGGDNYFRPEFFKAVRELTEKNDILFILDEVQSGMGITGKWWAYQHFGIEPDIIAFSKKMQTGGIMVSSKIDEEKDNVFHMESRINSTWGGNIADMVRATKIIQIMWEDKLVDNSKKVGEYLLKRLKELEADKPDFFSQARGKGLMCAIDIKDTATRDNYHKELFKNGLLALKCGSKGIRFRPPLICTKEDVDGCIAILNKSVIR